MKKVRSASQIRQAEVAKDTKRKVSGFTGCKGSVDGVASLM